MIVLVITLLPEFSWLPSTSDGRALHTTTRDSRDPWDYLNIKSPIGGAEKIIPILLVSSAGFRSVLSGITKDCSDETIGSADLACPSPGKPKQQPGP